MPAALLVAALQTQAAVVPHPLFSSNAVLQRDAEVPVWGAAAENEKVTVTFAGQTVRTIAHNGKWLVRLKPMPANTKPQTLTIAGTNSITIENILIGEVWLCSGQSNMEWPLAKSANGRKVAEKSIIQTSACLKCPPPRARHR
jgi:sialate O-acetylesterase